MSREKKETHKGGLMLTRRCGESIVIGDDISITITEVNGKQVRLQIVAPPEVKVDRAEIRFFKNG